MIQDFAGIRREQLRLRATPTNVGTDRKSQLQCQRNFGFNLIMYGDAREREEAMRMFDKTEKEWTALVKG